MTGWGLIDGILQCIHTLSQLKTTIHVSIRERCVAEGLPTSLAMSCLAL